jgi:hypothetical protein
MLKVDEFGDIYDGTNDNVRRSFCTLLFDKCYHAPNGRGYLILSPAQKEKKIFHPSPLGSLSRLTLSVQKPNGELLNLSQDNYKLFKVEYEQLNRQFLKIVINEYYDKNEFYQGDTVVFKDFEMTQNHPSITNEGMRKMNDFINRPEGHEIVVVGQANEHGYYRNFFITAPGQFDTVNGVFAVDETMITALNTYNNNIDYATITVTNGSILNTSLQCCLSFKMQVVATDPSVTLDAFKPSSS